MSFNRRLIKGMDGTVHGIFVYGDYGSTCVSKRNCHHGIALNDSRLAFVLESSYSAFGFTYDGFYIASFDMDGNLNFEKFLGDDADAYDLSREDNTLYNPLYGSYYVSNNEQDTDGILIAINHHEGTKSKHLINVSSSGTILHAVDCGFAAAADQGFCVGLSNGDAWVSTSLNDGELVLLDRSAATPYATDLVSNDYGATISIIGAATKNSSDQLVIAGSYSGAPASIRVINSSGTVVGSKEFYVLNDAGDDAECYAVCADSSDNYYVCVRTYDSSLADYFTHIVKFNSSLTVQWGVKVTGDLANQNRMFMCLSPDEQRVYYMHGQSAAESSFAVIDASTGAEVNIFALDFDNPSWDFFPEAITSNSTSVFITGVYADAVGLVGPGFYKFSQNAFEAGQKWPSVGIDYAASQRISSIDSVSVTASSAGISKSAFSCTPADSSAKFALSALDVSLTFSTTEFP